MYSGIDEAFLREIADHSHISVDDVRTKYQLIVSDLRDKARILDFIPLLAMNSVRQHFHDLNPHPSLSFNVNKFREDSAANSIDFFVQEYAHETLGLVESF